MYVCFMQPGADSVTEAFVRIRDEGGDVESTGPAGAALSCHFYLTDFQVCISEFFSACVCMYVCFMQPGDYSVTEAFVRIRNEGGDVESTGTLSAQPGAACHFCVTDFHVCISGFFSVCMNLSERV
jgi:hypothetical protein